MCLKIIASEDFASLNIATCRPAWDVTMTFLDTINYCHRIKTKLFNPATNRKYKNEKNRSKKNPQHHALNEQMSDKSLSKA
jgi:hypothetical protein